MSKRYVSIWFRHLTTDWLTLRKPELKDIPFVFAAPDHGRIMITAANKAAEMHGVGPGTPVADAKAVITDLQVIDDIPDMPVKLLKALGEWCIRYSPLVAANLPDGLILDASGCAHLWGTERDYLKEIVTRLISKGYDVRAAMADTIGTAWAIARFGTLKPIIEPGEQRQAMLSLPPAALRLEPGVLERLHKLGLRNIGNFINIPRAALRRRFGQHLLLRLDQSLGDETEFMEPLRPIVPYQERLPCMEPICTVTGIEIAIGQLLENLCTRLQKEGMGLRTAILKCYRVDGKTEQVAIGTNRPSHHVEHLFKLFQLRIATIEPALGIELFTMEAPKVEKVSPEQEALWATDECGLDDPEIAELLDRLAGKVGAGSIHRYLPAEHHWPERSIKVVSSLKENTATAWRSDKQRPVQLLAKPEAVEVTAPIPDYPPMLFRYKGTLHHIKKADGPERIEREWWLEEGEHRDYYHVEDTSGRRYWLFRSGHYSEDQTTQWFIHGFFA